ncbi:MAG: AmmeMemoRadiSam system protein B [Candidatus Iainarchaeum archaeon]|uniref:MEMO1 family protein DRO04_01605 n=1 Tax=Candidatus Iainarchaeum sp. TaxID=3101447 RepID=A0A497JIV8_9ARCH|nr:MAG: AmmeMemoRadiSam system protein B [Candidatus Diapherotrites archaeon]
MEIRDAAVEGLFYPRGQNLQKTLQNLFKNENFEEKFTAGIVPHAGFVYSGKVAAKILSKVKKAKTFVIIGPNHTGYGSLISLSSAEIWRNSLGDIKVDKELAEALLNEFSLAKYDDSAHFQEHSIEVILPFLQYRFKDFKILPIVIFPLSLEEARLFAQALASLYKKKEFTLLISSDFTHYQPLDAAKEKDKLAIDAIIKLDTSKFVSLITERNISICNPSGIVTLIEFCKLLNLKGSLLFYDTSATVSGNSASVVGYAAIGFA